MIFDGGREQNNNNIVVKIVIIQFLSLNNIQDDAGLFPYDSFESRKFSVSLSLTREVARQRRDGEREQKNY